MSEKRRHQRVRARGVAAHLRVDDMSSSAIIENISAGGVFIRLARPLPVGTPIAIDLVRPGLKKAFHLTGRVVSAVDSAKAAAWGRPPGIGIRFDAFPGADVERFAALLRDLGVAEPFEEPAGQGEPPAAAGQEPPPPPPPVSGRTSHAAAEPLEPAPVLFELEVPKQAPAAPGAAAEVSRLMNHVRGLLGQLGEAEERVAERDRRIATLEEELAQTRAELDEAYRQLAAVVGLTPAGKA